MLKKTNLLLAFVFFFFSLQNAQNTGYGVGIMLGEPTGLSGKYWINNINSLDAGLAWSFSNQDMIYAHADYVWHNYDFIKIKDGKLPFYYGVGAALGFGSEFNIQARFPIGIAYQFNSSPLDVFIEVVPHLSLVPSTSFGIGGAIGIRYFFK